VGVEDVPLLALAEAFTDGAELLDRILYCRIEPGDLALDLLGRDVEPRHASAAAIDGENAPDRHAGRSRDAE